MCLSKTSIIHVGREMNAKAEQISGRELKRVVQGSRVRMTNVRSRGGMSFSACRRVQWNTSCQMVQRCIVILTKRKTIPPTKLSQCVAFCLFVSHDDAWRISNESRMMEKGQTRSIERNISQRWDQKATKTWNPQSDPSGGENMKRSGWRAGGNEK